MELVAYTKLMDLKQAAEGTLAGLNLVINLVEEAVNSELRNDSAYAFGISIDGAKLANITMPSPEAVVEEKKSAAVDVTSADGMAAVQGENTKVLESQRESTEHSFADAPPTGADDLVAV